MQFWAFWRENSNAFSNIVVLTNLSQSYFCNWWSGNTFWGFMNAQKKKNLEKRVGELVKILAQKFKLIFFLVILDHFCALLQFQLSNLWIKGLFSYIESFFRILLWPSNIYLQLTVGRKLKICPIFGKKLEFIFLTRTSN